VSPSTSDCVLLGFVFLAFSCAVDLLRSWRGDNLGCQAALAFLALYWYARAWGKFAPEQGRTAGLAW